MSEYDEKSERANDLLRRYVLREYRDECKRLGDHLAACSDSRITALDASDGTYGCDTGCEYVRLAAVVECDHVNPAEYEFGTFTDLASLIDSLIREEASGC